MTIATVLTLLATVVLLAVVSYSNRGLRLDLAGVVLRLDRVRAGVGFLELRKRDSGKSSRDQATHVANRQAILAIAEILGGCVVRWDLVAVLVPLDGLHRAVDLKKLITDVLSSESNLDAERGSLSLCYGSRYETIDDLWRSTRELDSESSRRVRVSSIVR